MLWKRRRRTQDTLDTVTQQILNFFEQHLQEPAEYRSLALEECRHFPEGRIYPYAIPALAYVNLALQGVLPEERAKQQVEKLIDLLLIGISNEIHNGDSLLTLPSYQKQGTYLGTLNLTLGTYFLLSNTKKEGELWQLHEKLSGMLYDTLIEGDGEPIHSYPSYTWNIDTIFVLTSLCLFDKHLDIEGNTQPLLEAHLAWVQDNGLEPETGLPYSEGAHNTTSVWGQVFNRPPRGCDLSMQLCLLAQIAPDYARQLYQRYIKHFWNERGLLAGFREWSPFFVQPRNDIDTGPVVWDIGSTATGVGLGTTQAMGDQHRLTRLCQELEWFARLKKVMRWIGLGHIIAHWFEEHDTPLSLERYFTGFLYGDAVLFYALTWTPYPIEPLSSSQ